MSPAKFNIPDGHLVLPEGKNSCLYIISELSEIAYQIRVDATQKSHWVGII